MLALLYITLLALRTGPRASASHGGRGRRPPAARGRGAPRGRGTPAQHRSRSSQVRTRSLQVRCPSCDIELSDKNRRRHMAYCCPDLLDPEGWAQGDRTVVLAAAKCQPLARAAALQLRFGAPAGQAPPSAAQVAARFDWSPRRSPSRHILAPMSPRFVYARVPRSRP